MKHLRGMVCATVTPMDDRGAIDEAGVRSLFQYLTAMGVPCFYPNGTNGEGLSLSVEERQWVAKACVEEVQGRAAVYIQCGAIRPEEALAHVRHAKAVGADGAGIMTPVFWAVDEAGMAQYFIDILSDVKDFPAYLYNIPSRSGNDISAALLGRLMAQFGHLYGIKYSAPDLLRVTDYLRCHPDRPPEVLIGCDTLALCCLATGGAGYVSGPGAVFAKWFLRLQDAFQAGHMAQAQRAQQQMIEFQQRMQGIPEIPAIKYMLRQKGIIQSDTCRRPLRPLTDTERSRLDALLLYAEGVD